MFIFNDYSSRKGKKKCSLSAKVSSLKYFTRQARCSAKQKGSKLVVHFAQTSIPSEICENQKPKRNSSCPLQTCQVRAMGRVWRFAQKLEILTQSSRAHYWQVPSSTAKTSKAAESALIFDPEWPFQSSFPKTFVVQQNCTHQQAFRVYYWKWHGNTSGPLHCCSAANLSIQSSHSLGFGSFPAAKSGKEQGRFILHHVRPGGWALGEALCGLY